MEIPFESLDVSLVSDAKYDYLFKDPNRTDLFNALDLTTLAFWISFNNRYSFMTKYFDSRAARYFKYKNYDFIVSQHPGCAFLGRWYNENNYWVKRVKYINLTVTEISEDQIEPKFPLRGKFRTLPVYLILMCSEDDTVIVTVEDDREPFAACLSPDRTYLILYPVTVEGDYYKIDRTKKQLPRALKFLGSLKSFKAAPKPKYYISRVEFDGTTTMVEIEATTFISDRFRDTSAREATIGRKSNFVLTEHQLKTLRE